MKNIETITTYTCDLCGKTVASEADLNIEKTEVLGFAPVSGEGVGVRFRTSAFGTDREHACKECVEEAVLQWARLIQIRQKEVRE